MTESTIPAADAGLPSRRALVAGLALAPLAGVSARAGAMPIADPVFAALAELGRVQERFNQVGKVHATAEAAYLERRPKNIFLILNGRKFYDHEQIDSHFDDIEAVIKQLLSMSRRTLSPDEQAERDQARQAAHEELDRILAAKQEAAEQTGFREADDLWNKTFDELSNAEDAAIEAEPSSPAGAIAMLRFLAGHIDDFINPESAYVKQKASGCILRAVAVLECAPAPAT